jgi:hypothetical protein
MARPDDPCGVSPLRRLWLPWLALQEVVAWGDLPVPMPQVTLDDVLRTARLYDKEAKNGPESPA